MEYITTFAKHLYKDISIEALGKFINLFKEIKLSKNETLIQKNEISSKIHLIKSGVARSFFTNENGKEFTRNLFNPVTTIGSLNSILKGEPSNFTYDCLTDCVFLQGDFKKFEALTKTDLELAFLFNKILEEIIFKFIDRINELSTLNATDLYLKLKKEIPDIDNLIPQFHIASYLNITPVQLSRIRKKLYSK